MLDRLVVDANPLIAALMGGSAKRIFETLDCEFAVPQKTLFEVQRYLPMIAKQINRRQLEVNETFYRMPLTAYQPLLYDHTELSASAMIGARDPDDIPVLALALALHAPIWSNDSDFQGLPGVEVYTTAELLQRA